MLLSLDTYGWTRPDVPLSKRSITAIVPRRRRASGFVEDVGPHTRKPSRFDGLSAAETYREAGELEVRVAAAFARSAEVVAEAHRLGLAIGDLLRPVEMCEDRLEVVREERSAQGRGSASIVPASVPNVLNQTTSPEVIRSEG